MSWSGSSSPPSCRWSSCSTPRASRPWPRWVDCRARTITSSTPIATPTPRPSRGCCILRLDTPLYYFNATAVSDQVLRGRGRRPSEMPRAVLLDIEATIELDVTTSDALYGFDRSARGTRHTPGHRARQGHWSVIACARSGSSNGWAHGHVPQRAHRGRGTERTRGRRGAGGGRSSPWRPPASSIKRGRRGQAAGSVADVASSLPDATCSA